MIWLKQHGCSTCTRVFRTKWNKIRSKFHSGKTFHKNNITGDMTMLRKCNLKFVRKVQISKHMSATRLSVPENYGSFTASWKQNTVPIYCYFSRDVQERKFFKTSNITSACRRSFAAFLMECDATVILFSSSVLSTYTWRLPHANILNYFTNRLHGIQKKHKFISRAFNIIK